MIEQHVDIELDELSLDALQEFIDTASAVFGISGNTLVELRDGEYGSKLLRVSSRNRNVMVDES